MATIFQKNKISLIRAHAQCIIDHAAKVQPDLGGVANCDLQTATDHLINAMNWYEKAICGELRKDVSQCQTT